MIAARCLLVLVCGLAVVPRPAAQQVPAFTARTDGVRLHVAVADGGRPVTGLGTDQFVVTDNGVRQQVEAVSGVDALALAIAFDQSESVGGDPVDELKAAARIVLDALLPADTVALLTFSDRLNVRLPATRDHARVWTTLDRAQSEIRTRTALWDAMLAGAGLVARQAGRPVLMMVTDGCENASWITPAQATTWLGRSDLTVDMLWFGITRRKGGSRPFNITNGDGCRGRLEFGDAAKATGGEMFQTDRRDLAKVLTARVAALRSGYFLTYTPTGVKQDDGWHKVEVRLQGVRGRATTRDGYYAGGGSE